MKLDRKTFEQQRSLRFGRTNPERMRLAFWEAMVQDGNGPYRLRERFEAHAVTYIQFMNPSKTRVLFQFRKPSEVLVGLGKALVALVKGNNRCRISAGGPIWNFDRMGQTRTKLVDGRTICVGGEHEDHYDPDFAIYNDVVVLHPDDQVEIYGYPKAVFPPTDFHTASLIGDRIIIIGGLGYLDARRPGFTPVQSLDLSTYRIEPIAATGSSPGWIFKHEAEIDPSGESITIRGGEIEFEKAGVRVHRQNIEEYRLHLADGRWEQITDRRDWRQFEIKRKAFGMLFDLPDLSNFRCGDGNLPRIWFDDEVFQPKSVPHDPILIEDLNLFALEVDQVTIRAEVDAFMVRLIVEGKLPEQTVNRAIEEIFENIETAIGAPCQIEEL